MGYRIYCATCNKDTWASEIVDLIDNHSNSDGRFQCKHCHGVDTFIHRESKLQESGEVWERYIKGVIRIKTQYPTYSPYVFLVADEKNGPVTGIHFNYYKDTRPDGGRLKHGHGPGGAPLFSKGEYIDLTRRLMSFGILSKADFESILM